jgi:alpha-L-fucosidase
MTANPENFAQREPARQWFANARFGLFIHWGIYSTLASGEWVMNDRKIRAVDYERLAEFFNPIRFDPDEWVSAAKRAGMRYLTFTSRHHDGFAMFDSKASDWNIVKRTPFKHDVVKMLADSCHRAGIKLFLYYSLLDWHHPDYFPLGTTGHDSDRPKGGSWPRYIDFMEAQLKELLTNYGEIGGIWFDGWWDRPDADWQLPRLYSLIHKLQPNALVGNNHHRAPFPGEDFQMWERDLPGQNQSGYSPDGQIADLPLETCDTINKSWGYNLTDHDFKPASQLVHYLEKAAGNGANLLLNIGPMPDGRFPPECTERLAAMGEWTKTHGQCIYKTTAGALSPQPWGITTQNSDELYVHLLDPTKVLTSDEDYVVISIPAEIGVGAPARLLVSGKPIEVQKSGEDCLLHVPRSLLEEPTTVIAVTRHSMSI